jgi:acetylglutamate kinase
VGDDVSPDLNQIGLVEAGEKASTLVEALPYIRRYRGTTLVVKIGGEALDDPRLAEVVAEDLALLSLVGIRLVVVHGGGPQINAALARAGLESQFVGGLRVTGDPEMEIVRQVLVGSINADLVARLRKAGAHAVGLSGNDGGMFVAERTSGPDGEDLGRVGRIVAVDPSLARSLLEQGYVPVVATVAPDADGLALNVNADLVAGPLAGALRAEKLVYLTNVEGLYRDLGDRGSLISTLSLRELTEMLPTLSSGMKPKASSAAHALQGGVKKVHILDGRVEHALLLEVFTDAGIGTQVEP